MQTVSVPKKHHYLPEFYLKGFCTDGELWMYDRKEDTYHKRRPETVAIRKTFYSVEDQEGNRDHKEVEKRLNVVESQTAPVIHKLDAGERIELNERYALAMFVALLQFRTPQFERQMGEIGGVLSSPEGVKELLAPSVDAVRVQLEQLGYGGPGIEEQARTLYEEIHGRDPYFQSSPNDRVEAMLQNAHKFGRELVLKPWTIARSSEGSSFITADAPLVVSASADSEDPFSFTGPGIIPPGYETWVPLSRHTCLIIGNEALDGCGILLQEGKVRTLNVALAAQSERFFMADGEALLLDVARALPQEITSGWCLPGNLSLTEIE